MLRLDVKVFKYDADFPTPLVLRPFRSGGKCPSVKIVDRTSGAAAAFFSRFRNTD